jgi:hypothetical protein
MRAASFALAFLLYASSSSPVDDALRQRATQLLRTAFEREEQWIKVHAAEALLAAGNPEGVKAAFDRELTLKGNERPYRIGIWRVLAQTARNDEARQGWIKNIFDAFRDAESTDRLHAAETLGKLGYRPSSDDRDVFELAAKESTGPLAANARWVLANSGRSKADAQLVDLLGVEDGATRATAAYAIRFLPKIPIALWGKLLAAARKEPESAGADIVRASLVSAAFIHAPADQQKAAFKAELLKYARTGSADAKIEACGALAMQGQDEDVALLVPLLDEGNVDVRVAAASAILQIDKRRLRAR